MKVLFTVPGRMIWSVDKEKHIFVVNKTYYDVYGNTVFFQPSATEDNSDSDGFDFPFYFGRHETGIKEKLKPESITDIEYEIDDEYGQYGFKNDSGEFVIESQYAYAMGFSNGLAAVNLNRTWYTSIDGRRTYENHYGYINERGETVIPFSFVEAWPFNKYGVAVVTGINGDCLIDMEGNPIPGTNKLNFETMYEYNQRYLTISKYIEEDNKDLVGLYDTEERRIVIDPTYDDLSPEEDKGFVRVSEKCSGSFEAIDRYQYVIDLEGKDVFPWLTKQKFYCTGVPNRHELAVVATSRYEEAEEKVSGFIPFNGHKYVRILKYGIYSGKEKFVLPAEYDEIWEIDYGLYSCSREGYVSLIQI